MSFEKTKQSISNLSEVDVISLDLLFDMLVCVSQDIMSYNKSLDLRNTPVGDQNVMLRKIYNIMQLTYLAYDSNRGGIDEFIPSVQAKFFNIANQIEEAKSAVSDVNAQLDKVEKQKEELESENAKLKDIEKKLSAVEDECISLQTQIDKLSDLSLEDKEKEKITLEADLKVRTAKAESLDNDISKLHLNIDEVHKSIENLEDALALLKESFDSLSKNKEVLVKEKEELERNSNVVKMEIEDYNKWKEEFTSMSEHLKAEYDENQAKITTLINACKSAVSETFLRENLFKYPDSSEAFSVENNADCCVAQADFKNIEELKNWFENMDRRINGLINTYGTMYKTLVEQSEKNL